MKQVLQHAGTGEIAVVEVPAPSLQPGCVRVRISASLVSAGTERASSEFATKSLLGKARARPDLVHDVIEKVRRDGFYSAVHAVRSRLDQPVALGYSSAGIVVGLGEGVTDIRVGDRVACAGAGYAVHAEIACIPRLLVACIPAHSVSLEEAAFTTVGSVALHAIRTAEVRLGEIVAVIGLGLLGQLTVQILKAAGCHVIGMDVNPQRVELARRLGANHASTANYEFSEMCSGLSNGHGADAVLITAETPSSDPVNLAAKVARDRGVVVAVGTTGMDIERKLYYEKELQFRISRSYGPGRYDAAYEQKGRDYPIGHIRWTETRNMAAFLQLLAAEKLDVKSLITHRVPIVRARDAYEIISGKSGEPFLGVVIQYPEEIEPSSDLELVRTKTTPAGAKSAAIGLLGAGSFATGTLLPAMGAVAGVEMVGVCAASGASSQHAAKRFGFRFCTTDEGKLIGDPAVNTVVIATRHYLHAAQVLAVLRAGKHVFCEKPLCLTEDELAGIVRVYEDTRPSRRPLLMVGFNRRFAPMAVRMKAFLEPVEEPLVMHYRVNAGYLPPDHWVNDPELGGGRILGEVCHFVDFLSFLAGALPVGVQAACPAALAKYSGDNVVISLQFANGSQGTISYLANGDSSFSKERVEVFGGGTVAVLDDFHRLELVGHGRRQVFRSWLRQDKGHRAQWQSFVHAIQAGKDAPIPFAEIVATTLATFRVLESRSLGRPQVVNPQSLSDKKFHSQCSAG